MRNSVEMKELINVSDKEAELYASKAHLPNFIAYEITHCIQEAFRAGNITVADHLNIRNHTQSLLNITGACERILKTPIPFSYNVYLKLFITVYAICLPIALVPLFGYWSIIIIGFIFFAFLGLELMAEEIENPFGLDCNDLPTGDIANTIKKNVFEIFEIRQIEQEQPKALYDKVF